MHLWTFSYFLLYHGSSTNSGLHSVTLNHAELPWLYGVYSVILVSEGALRFPNF